MLGSTLRHRRGPSFVEPPTAGTPARRMSSSDQDDPGRQGADAGVGGPARTRASTTSGPARASDRPGAPGGVAGPTTRWPTPAMSVTSPATPRVARRRSPGRSARTRHEALRPGAARARSRRGRTPDRGAGDPGGVPRPGRGGDPVGPPPARCPTGSGPCPAVDAGPGRRRATRWAPRLPLERRRALEQARGLGAGAPRRQPGGPRARYRGLSRPPWPDTGAIPPAVVPTPAATPRRARHRGYPALRDADTGGYPGLGDADPSGYRASPRGRRDRLGRPWWRRRARLGAAGRAATATAATPTVTTRTATTTTTTTTPSSTSCPSAAAAAGRWPCSPSWSCCAMVGGWFGWSWVQGKIDPSGAPGDAVLVEIPEGTSTAGVGDVLADAGVISDATVWDWYTKLRDVGTIKAGTLRDAARLVVHRGASTTSRPSRCRPRSRRMVTMPRGLTQAQIATRLVDPDEGVPGFTPEAVQAALADPSARSAYLPADQPLARGHAVPRDVRLRRGRHADRSWCSGWCTSSTTSPPSST